MVSAVGSSQGVISTQIARVQNDQPTAAQPARTVDTSTPDSSPPPPPPPTDTTPSRGSTVDTTA